MLLQKNQKLGIPLTAIRLKNQFSLPINDGFSSTPKPIKNTLGYNIRTEYLHLYVYV